MTILLAGYALVVALGSCLADRLWPIYEARKLVVAVSLPGPILLILSAIGLLIYIEMQPAGSGEMDAGGMALIAIIGTAGIGSATMLCIGLVSAWLPLRILRRKR